MIETEDNLEFTADFHILFNKTDFPINKDLFCHYSPKFKDMVKSVTDDLSIDLTETRVHDISFATFVRACQQKPYSINPTNYYDIRYLAADYRVKHLIEECKEFLANSVKSDLVIHRLYYKIRKGSNLKKIIKIIAYNFTECLSKKELLFVPDEYLKAILNSRSNPSVNQHYIFKFLTKKYENDETSSFLFETLDPTNFTIYELKWLMSQKKINTDFIPNNVKDKVKSIKDEISEQQEIVNSYNEQIEKLDHHSSYNHIFHRIHHLKLKLSANDHDKSQSEVVSSTPQSKSTDFDYNDEIDENENLQQISELTTQISETEEKLADIDMKTQDLDFKFGQLIQYLETQQ